MPDDLHFVISDWKKWAAVLSGGLPRIQDIASGIISNEDIWVAQTYIQLSARGLRATIGNEPWPGKINVLDGISLQSRVFLPNQFLVGCRGDGHYPAICQRVIQQNTLVQSEQPATYIPQWPQPGIIPRALTRVGVRTIGFFGHSSINLSSEYRDQVFFEGLHWRGCTLKIHGKSASPNWSDYSDIDLVIAVRDIPYAHLILKPVNKLVNAWIAGVPALMGVEPAVQAVTESPLDFVPITKPSDVFCILERFNLYPDLYKKMVEHGRMRALSFNEDAVADRWLVTIQMLREEFGAWDFLSSHDKAIDYERRVQNHKTHIERHFHAVHGSYRSAGYDKDWWCMSDSMS
jgi:hypothetical protein